jgi:hypothetical protein
MLCRHFFQQYVREGGYTVLDVGASYCEFINNIVCRRKLALDLSADVRKHVEPGVEVLETKSSSDLCMLSADTVDVVFASNFFEYLPYNQELAGPSPRSGLCCPQAAAA